MKRMFVILSLALIHFLFISFFVYSDDSRTRVILISVDGLRPDAITTLGPSGAPNFYRLINEGASTANARTDPDITITMPNHTSMLTGRGVKGIKGHGFTNNKSADLSIHQGRKYVASVFDVVKDHGLSTGFFASKRKFKVFINSYGDLQPVKKSSKIDVYDITDHDDIATLQSVLAQIEGELPDFTFVHFAGLDDAGHEHGWNLDPQSEYMAATRLMDVKIGEILEALANQPALAKSTVIILTSDHGGIANDHEDITKIEVFRIPFIIWGKGVATRKDLYRMNEDLRRDPGFEQVSYAQAGQPIRNGDAANLACAILGLPLVPGSTIANPNVIRINQTDTTE